MTTHSKLASSDRARSAADDHIELALDRALEATFPASDAIALTLGRDFPPALHAGRPIAGRSAAAAPHPRLAPPRSR